MFLKLFSRATLLFVVAIAAGCGGSEEQAPEIPPEATTEDAANEGLATEAAP